MFKEVTKENRSTTNDNGVKGTTPTERNGETRATDMQAIYSTLAILDDKSVITQNIDYTKTSDYTKNANNSGTTSPFNDLDDE